MKKNERTLEEIFMALPADIQEELGCAFMTLQSDIECAKALQERYNYAIKRIDDDNSKLWSILLRAEYGNDDGDIDMIQG